MVYMVRHTPGRATSQGGKGLFATNHAVIFRVGRVELRIPDTTGQVTIHELTRFVET